MFLYRKCLKSHLKAVEKRCHGRRPCDIDLIFSLENIQKSPSYNLRIESLKRQKHNAEIRSIRWFDVLRVNILRFRLDNPFKVFRRFFDCCRIAKLVCIHKPAVGIRREFGIDRKPYRAFVIAGEFDRKLHSVGTCGFRNYILCVLLRRKNLLKNCTELHLTENSSCLYIGKNFLEISHADCKILHLAETFIYLFQSIVYKFKRLRDSLIERFLQLFINGFSHFFELSVVFQCHLRKTRIDVRKPSVHVFGTVSLIPGNQFSEGLKHGCRILIAFSKLVKLLAERTCLNQRGNCSNRRNQADSRQNRKQHHFCHIFSFPSATALAYSGSVSSLSSLYAFSRASMSRPAEFMLAWSATKISLSSCALIFSRRTLRF